MLIKNLTEKELYQALDLVNQTPLLNGNLAFRKIEKKGKKKEIYRVVLKTLGYNNYGYRRGQGEYTFTRELGKRLPYACWHSHGLFFIALYRINPMVEIVSQGEKIDPFTWIDKNIGSRIMPLWYSEACDCPENLVNESIKQILPEGKELCLDCDYGQTTYTKNG